MYTVPFKSFGAVIAIILLSFVTLMLDPKSFSVLSNNPAVVFVILGLSSLFLIVIYPFAKRFTWWPQLFLGLAFNWGILLLFAAHTGSLNWPIIALYFAGIFWTLFYDTIYAYQDSQDDLIIGVKSTAILFGEHAKKWLFSFISFCFVLMAVSVFIVTQERTILSKFVSFIGVLSFILHLFSQWKNFDANDSQVLLSLFALIEMQGLFLLSFFVWLFGFDCTNAHFGVLNERIKLFREM